MDGYLLPPPPPPPSLEHGWPHQAENMALISLPDVHVCNDSGSLEFDLGTTDAYPTAPSIEPPNPRVDEQVHLEDLTFEPDEPPRQPPKPLRLRRPIISSTVWEGLKPVIQDLYIRQRLSLDEVRQRMKLQHDFDATEQMYKKRLRDWGLRKNYTQTQKLEVIQKLREAPSETCGYPPLQVNGEPLNERRLWRPVMQKRNRVVLALRTSPDSNKDSRKRLLQFRRTSTPQRLQLHLGRETQTVEALLRYAHVYHSWYPAQDQIRVQYGYTMRLREAFDKLREAVLFLVRNDSTAFCLINRSCSHFRALLQAQPFLLLAELVTVFTDFQLGLAAREHWKVWEAVLKFFASLAKTILGMLHPITNFVILFQKSDQEHLPSCSRLYAELLLDEAKTARDATASAKIKLAAVGLLEASGQSDNAFRLCRLLWDDIHLPASTLTQLHTGVIGKFVRLSRYRGDYLAAEKLLMQICNGNLAVGEPLEKFNRIFACTQLGWVHFWKGERAQSEKYFRLALEETLENEGRFSQSAIQSILSQLETVLWMYGKDEALAQLRVEYQSFWAPLDDWRLDRGSQGSTGLLRGLG
ncbi:hypothetical protein AYL99_02744 [Fonsecaea erecta]|uniref:Clr5 domain-containing protein n=1 Tax=Fonsecaea erecta TaxID=1367422 RepID=A0A178ZUS6_9EURO|nr:hypothetical protein AYL99_02744 [Fonsecaea erecta]OAP63517.1 hypothetical protein AYL99_02744 [Fonsecaea erecta]